MWESAVVVLCILGVHMCRMSPRAGHEEVVLVTRVFKVHGLECPADPDLALSLWRRPARHSFLGRAYITSTGFRRLCQKSLV